MWKCDKCANGETKYGKLTPKSAIKKLLILRGWDFAIYL